MTLAEDGDEQIGVLIERKGFRQEIPISETRLRAYIEAEGMAETQRYVDELADQVRAALRKAQTP